MRTIRATDLRRLVRTLAGAQECTTYLRVTMSVIVASSLMSTTRMFPFPRSVSAFRVRDAELSQLKKHKLEAARSSGAVQGLRMENDAPVVGPGAPTANSKMVKLDIATADWSRPPGLRVNREQADGHSSIWMVYAVRVHSFQMADQAERIFGWRAGS